MAESVAKSPDKADLSVTKQVKSFILQDIWFPEQLQQKVNELYDVALLSEASEEQFSRAEGIISVLHGAIDESVFCRASKLKVVSNFGAGYDHVDVKAAEKRGILCGHTPGAVAEATGELGIALVVAAARKIVAGNRRARNLHFDAWWFGRTLSGLTLGVVGMGDIGTIVARKAALGFGMNVQYFGRTRKTLAHEQSIGNGGATFCPDLIKLCATSDVIVVTVALTPATSKLIGAKEFSAMKKDVIFVNIARGAVVDTEAIIDALQSEDIGIAALDVTEPEPLTEGHPLLKIDDDRLILTPHVGTACLSARTRMLQLALANLEAGLNGNALPHCAVQVQ